MNAALNYLKYESTGNLPIVMEKIKNKTKKQLLKIKISSKLPILVNICKL